MNDIKVSIIIPVYNPGNLLKKCLDSALNQTLQNIEVICINDGSTDGSLNILNEYASNDSRLKVISQQNQGAGIARNVGIKIAKGDYIIFLDSDDWIENDMCELLYDNADNLNSDMVLFNAIRHQEDNTTRDLIQFDEFNDDYYSFTFDYHHIKDKVLNGYFGVIWSKFYKTSFLKENDITFTKHKMFNDVEFHIKTMLLAEKMSYYPKIFYHYMMIGQESLQKTYAGTGDSICFYDVMLGVREFLKRNNFMDEFRIEYLDYLLFYFKLKLKQMDDDHKQEYYSKIKSFLESEKITKEEFGKITNRFIPFYMHILNTNNFKEYKIVQDKYDGEAIQLDNNYKNIDYIEKSAKYELTSNKIYENLLENKINELTDNLKTKDKSIKVLENEITQKNSSFNDLKNSHDTTLKQLAQTQDTLKNELNKTITEKTKENNDLKNKINAINKVNTSKTNENNKLKEDMSQLNTEITNKNHEITKLQKELSLQSDLINELKINFNEIEIIQKGILEENSEQNKLNSELISENKQLKNKLSESTKLINDFKINLDKLKEIQNCLIEENTKLNNDKKILQDDLDEIKSSTLWKIKSRL